MKYAFINNGNANTKYNEWKILSPLLSSNAKLALMRLMAVSQKSPINADEVKKELTTIIDELNTITKKLDSNTSNSITLKIAKKVFTRFKWFLAGLEQGNKPEVVFSPYELLTPSYNGKFYYANHQKFKKNEKALSETEGLLPTSAEKILIKTNREKLNSINAPVKVTDIVVRQSREFLTGLNPKGEFHFSKSKKRSLIRIIDYVTLLIDITERHHLHNNFDQDPNGNFVMRKGHENEVTRLVLHECALYPSEFPLTKLEFEKLVNTIKEIAKTKHENIILVLATVPVLGIKYETTNNQEIPQSYIMNCAIHIQCGTQPQVNIVSKINPSDIDPDYNQMPNSNFWEKIDKKFSLLLSSSNKNSTIDRNLTFECKTQGGAKFWTVLEICLDHASAEGKNSLERKMAEMQENAFELIPTQVSQIIVSNSIFLKSKNFVNDSVAYADPIYKPVKLKLNNAQTLDHLVNLSQNYQNSYRTLKTSADNNKGKLTILNPPFGEDTAIIFCPPYQLEFLDKVNLKLANKHNEKVINQYSIQQARLSMFNHSRNSLVVDTSLIAAKKAAADENCLVGWFLNKPT